MPRIVAYEDVKATRIEKNWPDGHKSWRTNFFGALVGDKEGPTAFLAEGTPERQIRTHYHDIDQFQIVVEGDGALGRHKLDRTGVHFARAYTPYGPLYHGKQGLGFVTLRARADPGPLIYYIPDTAEELKRIRDRNPWQTSEMPKFGVPDAKGVALEKFKYIRDERGLSVHSLAVAAGAKGVAPAPEGEGQFILVIEGDFVHEGQKRDGLSVIWLGPKEKAFEFCAGEKGFKAMVVNFPIGSSSGASRPDTATDKRSGHKTWGCSLCSFVYDEAEGMPHEGLPAGTRWQDVPEDFACPDCSARKADFEEMDF